jgi:predicted NUDIX family phosphoesterase
MVVETKDLAPFLGATLIRERAEEILFLISTRHFFIDRDAAEVSPQYKQIIPYVVIRCGEEYFVLERTSKQTEARLHHKVSLGIGGHINPGHTLLEGLEKELGEEVDVDTDFEIRFAGILNDDSTEVGRVHLGAVYVLEAETRDVRVRETEKMTGGWMARAALAPLRGRMETWSQIVYDEIIK